MSSKPVEQAELYRWAPSLHLLLLLYNILNLFCRSLVQGLHNLQEIGNI